MAMERVFFHNSGMNYGTVFGGSALFAIVSRTIRI